MVAQENGYREGRNREAGADAGKEPLLETDRQSYEQFDMRIVKRLAVVGHNSKSEGINGEVDLKEVKRCGLCVL